MRARFGAGTAAFLGLLVVPFVWSSFTAYELGLYLLYGMVGQGIALCWGRAGFLPLGQALFFGIGAYLAGAGLKTFGGGSWLLAPVLAGACLVPALLAGAVGALVFHRQMGSGPYFSLITLALAMLGFQLANSLVEVTGGFNGMTGIPALAGIDPFEHLYFVIVAALAVTTMAVAWLGRAPFGQLLAAIAQNEERLQFFAFRTSRLKAAAFAVSAGVAGLAGALYAPHQGIVTPQAVGFLLSAELVIWTAVGGRASLAGPVLGAVAIGFLASGLRDTFVYWEVVVALVFVVVVLRWPDGMAGLLASVLRVAWSQGRGPPAERARERTITLARSVAKPNPSLRFEEVGVTVGSVEILKRLSFRVDTKAIHCLIGPNGAGKTSALDALTGRLPLTAGDIRWAGRSLAGERIDGAAARGIGRKSQVPSIFPGLTIGQNVDIALWANRLRTAELVRMAPYRWRTALLAGLESRFPFLRGGGQPAGSLSVGERQMLDFALTMLAEPELVLLDEPCAGLSVEETVRMTEAIAALCAEIESTGIIIEHDMEVVERLSDHVLVMHQGGLLASGTLDEIRRDPAVQAVYAGGSKG